jgi:flagellar biosynthesis chaperone FliJ
MTISSVSNGTSPFVQHASSGGDDIAQLQQQREMLQKQLETALSKLKDGKTDKNTEKQIELLQEKIAEIDQKIQSLLHKQQQSQNALGTSSTNSNNGLRNKPETTSNMVDTYI